MGFVFTAQAALPGTINFQGYLTDSSGAPVNSPPDVSITFRLYTTEGGASMVWEETQAVTLNKGLFSVELGAVNPLNLSDFDTPLFLGITVEGDAEMTPRQLLSNTGYSLRSQLADSVLDNTITSLNIEDGAIGAADIASGAVTAEKLGINCAVGEVLVRTETGWVCTTLGGVPVCSPGDFINCYGGPQGTLGVGVCKSGTRTCNATGTGFDACANEVVPGNEVCDGEDNDCDGQVDEGAVDATTWYVDADADGYGDAADSIVSCQQPAGYVAQAGDCNDGDAGLNPGAMEFCDGIDNNCDGQVDNDCTNTLCTPEESACLQTCVDVDCGGDPFCATGCAASCGVSDLCNGAYGDLMTCGVANCAGVSGQAELEACMRANCAAELIAVFGPECTDGEVQSCGSDVGACQTGTQTCTGGLWEQACVGEIAPQPEICNGIDDNCDGAVDESGQWWYSDADGDGYGGEGDQMDSCTQPPDYVADGNDCDDNDPAVNPGAAEICDGTDNNCDGVVDEGFDLDADGFASCGGDCDDGDASVNPDAVEVCDGLDNNCDGVVDEGFDLDADGVTTCAGDCDDAKPAVYPGAAEICDGTDNNCDGQVDEGVLQTWYEDWDTDGYGDALYSVQACGQPAGYVADATDCNDLNANVNPSAVEICDGIDNNCDGQIDEGCP